ncbi:uncharacterized protein LOC115376422 isoform X2 [Myripristis murdjan]|uniref:uncharacterized protein LOC115376422 isoform X2 n=1 Tax=Myripristis murdjan TaxID=586833 RepID=UPI001175E978|nr:uncharacterized protein LOC115376422 isoform X2 [Myripristis murdjan]
MPSLSIRCVDDSSASVLCFHRKEMISILLLADLITSVCGELQVNVSQAVYQAEENSNITMDWTFTPIIPLTDLSIYISLWVSEYKPLTTIYYLRDGVENTDFQDEQFTGRVQLDKDELRKGNIRLHLSSLRINDSGSYWCQMSTRDEVGITESSLNVTAATRLPEEPKPTEGGGTALVGSVTPAQAVLAPVVFVVAAALVWQFCRLGSPDQQETDTTEMSVQQSGEETTSELQSAGNCRPYHTLIP